MGRRMETDKAGQLESHDGFGDGWDKYFNWNLLIQADSKSVLWLGADPEGKPRTAASPAALSVDGRSQPS